MYATGGRESVYDPAEGAKLGLLAVADGLAGRTPA
jgi:hypothetical protein